MLDDLISRQNAIEASTESNLKSHMGSVEDELENCVDDEFIRLGEAIDDEILNSYFRIRSIIMSRSSTERKGKWIFNPNDTIEAMFTKPKCSECGFKSADGGNYCSNWGADMRGEEDEIN